jgi:hypothetical protein
MAATTRARTGKFSPSTPRIPSAYPLPSTPTSNIQAYANIPRGNSKPRIVQQIENVVAPKTKTKANTSKPRTSKVATGRVTKPKATTTTTKKTSAAKPKATTTKAASTKKTTGANVKTVKKPRTKTEKVVDKVVGKAEKIVGDVEGKPGKKAAGTAKARGTDSTTKRAAPRARAAKA